MKFWKHTARDTSGAEIAEAAIVLPLVFMLMLGIYWFGRAYNIYATVTHAAREGARAATAPACALCGNAAMRSGAGLVTVGTPVSSQPLVATQVMPEVMTASLAETDRGAVSDEAASHVLKLAERANVIAIGPGLSSEEERTRAFVRTVVQQRQTPLVIELLFEVPSAPFSQYCSESKCERARLR